MHAFHFDCGKKRPKGHKRMQVSLFSQMPYGEDKMLCLVRFLRLLIQTSDTSDLFYTFNILKFKRLVPKGRITETQQNINTCVMLGYTGS